jgi:DNA-binding CsgD family transcriptional regulator
MHPLQIWRAWTTPTTGGELARRREAVLLGTLAGLLVLSLALQAVQLVNMLFVGVEQLPWWLFNVAVAGSCYGLLRRAHAGRPRTAAVGLLALLALSAVALLVVSGTLNPMPMLLIAMILLLTAILLGARAAFGALVPTAVTLLVVIALQRQDVLPLDPIGPDDQHKLSDVIGFVAVLGYMAIVLGLYTRDVLTSVDEALTHGNPESPLRQLRTKSLTMREIEVVQLVAEGLSNDKIASQLFVSPRTVQTHVANAMRKAGCANRTELGVLALREGLVPLRPADGAEPAPA